MDCKKKTSKIIKHVANSLKDTKNITRRELRSTFYKAINTLSNSNVKEALELQFEKYLSELERRISENRENGIQRYLLKPEQVWKAPKGMSDQEEDEIRCCVIAKKLKKGFHIAEDLSLLKLYQRDKTVLMKLCPAVIPIESLKNVTDIYSGYFQVELEKRSHSKSKTVESIEQLADFTEECLRWVGLKYRNIPDNKDTSFPYYGDIMAGICSLYIDMRTILSRDMEKKEKKKSAMRLCGFVSSLIPQDYELDVLLQLAEVSPEDEKFLKPLVQKYLMEVNVEGNNSLFLKFNICVVTLSKLWPETLQKWKQSAYKIPAPNDFMSWISSQNPKLLESMPTDRKFVGVHITKFLLEDLDEELAEQLLDAVCSNNGKVTETSEKLASVDIVENEEPKEESDVEVIEETENSSIAPPGVDVFFIDKGKPQAQDDIVINLESEEEMVVEDEVLNSTTVLSETEDTEPIIIVEDALEEIEEVLQKVNHDEVEDKESEEENEDVVILDDLIEKARAKGTIEQSVTSLGNFEMELSSTDKQSNSEKKETELDKEFEMTGSKDGVGPCLKSPEGFGRSRSRRTSTRSQRSNECKMTKEEDTGIAVVHGSPTKFTQSMKEKDVLDEVVEDKSTDYAQDSMVSDSCESDASDFVSYPNIGDSVKTTALSNEKDDDFMSPAIERAQMRKKKQTRRNLMKEDILVAEQSTEDTDVYTFIMSPAKKSKTSDEGESSQKEEENVHVTRSRLRRKTTSDLPSQIKDVDTKKNKKRKSVTSSGNSSSEKNSKITEFFKGTPLRTRGKAICKNEDENRERENKTSLDDQQSETERRESMKTGRDRKVEESERETSRNKDAKELNMRRSTRRSRQATNSLSRESEGEITGIETPQKQNKNIRLETPSAGKVTLPSIEELNPRRTRSQSESKSSKNVSAQKDKDAIDITNIVIESAEDSNSEMEVISSTPTKSPKNRRFMRRGVLRTRKATPAKGDDLSETSSSSVYESFSTVTGSRRKSLRSRKT